MKAVWRDTGMCKSDLYPTWVCGETLQSIAPVMFPKAQPGKAMQTEALTCLKSLLGIKYK